MSSLIFRSTYNKPVLLVGNGVRASGAEHLVTRFAEKSNIPVLTSMNAVDLVQGNRRIGFIGTHGNRVANLIVKECDCLLAIGARLGIRQVGKNPEAFAPNAHIIRVDIDEHELARPVHEDEESYLSDARDFMLKLLGEDVPDYSAWMEKCLNARDLLAEVDLTEGNKAVEKISDLLPQDATVAVDVGQNQCWCAQSLRVTGDQARILIAGGYGSMGCGLPFAIGSAIARKGSPVFCITGDGGMQMNIQELEVLSRENLPIKIIILNNRVLGKIYETQRADLNGRFAATSREGGYTVPSFEKIATAYGIKASTLSSFKDLDGYRSWFDDDEPCLLDILLPEDSWLRPKINWTSGKMRPSVHLEDVAIAMLK